MPRNLVRSASVAFALAVTGACGSSDGTAPVHGTVIVKLTDAPFPSDSVARVDVFVVRVDARVQATDSTGAAAATSADSAAAGGWTTVAAPGSLVNLLDYQNGNALNAGDTTLAAGTYAGLRLIIDPSQSSITLKNGMVLSGTSNPNVTFPSAARSGLKVELSQPMVIVANDTTTVTVDFDVGNSFVMRGNSITQNGLLFKPVIRAAVH